MAFPDESLAQGEEVKLHLHPHWIVMVAPLFWTVVAVAGVIAGAIFLPTNSTGTVGLVAIGVIALVLFLWLAFAPFVVWRSTHFVFTNERVISRSGVFSQHTENIPMDRVSDVQLDQSLFDRILGCGKLALASPGEHGPDQLRNIPHVKAVTVKLHDLIDPATNAPQQRSSSDGTTQTLSHDN